MKYLGKKNKEVCNVYINTINDTKKNLKNLDFLNIIIKKRKGEDNGI